MVAAANGKEAWEKFQAGDFSIVVSDWMMPEIDGIELVRKIRLSQTTGYVYVVLLTARSETEDVVVGMEGGADDFLTKPFHATSCEPSCAGQRSLSWERTAQRMRCWRKRTSG